PVYRPVADVPAWTEAALSLLEERRANDPVSRSRRDAGLARAKIFNWSHHADQLAAIYRQVLGNRPR
ncbi:hypothetical protein ACYOEI_02980, partial [Singulisphaera rosea]